ncbi:hypothetical protein QYE76_069011 [Lolium multiflorum]|uniref:F-box domain-containing protein n=1 Tax=Lolium multiflorum TaxID=4521 RepID=A0AAD8SGX5_LOLMU|nr:hypothetical protein QYE76_069011 [Lolium multiflorum]
MEHIDGEIAAPAPPRLPPGEDRLSALPDDILIQILMKLRDAAAAAKTSVLSRHWRRHWALLPELCFHPATGPQGIRAALESHEGLITRRLAVEVIDATPESLTALLLVAAPRLSGDLQLINEVGQKQTEDEAAEAEAENGALELPCFENATTIRLDLGYLALAMPPLGVFAGLTDLFLAGVDLRGPCMLGDAASSLRCPALRKLTVHHARGRLANFAIHSDSLLEIDLKHLQADGALGLGKFTIHSASLLQIELRNLQGIQALTVFAPALQMLSVIRSFANGVTQPVANIYAPQLKFLTWNDAYDASSTQFCNMKNIKCVATYPFSVYGKDACRSRNSFCLRLIRRFELIRCLRFMLFYVPDITNEQYLMEDITRLPDITHLALDIYPNGHSFGASVFHVLGMCTGVKMLLFTLRNTPGQTKAQTACPSGCACDQPPNWKNQKLALNCLQKVQIWELRGTEHEAALMKRLFDWATVLEKVTIAFHGSVPESKAKEFFQMLQSFSRLEIRVKQVMAPLAENQAFLKGNTYQGFSKNT